MILNPFKTMALVFSRSRTVDPPHGGFGRKICLGECVWFPFELVLTSTFLHLMKIFDNRLTFEDHVRPWYRLRVSQRIGILRLVKRVFMDTFVLLRCYYAFILPILEYCSPVWGLLLNVISSLDRQVYSVDRFYTDQTFLSLFHRRHVAVLCMFFKVNSNSNHCLFSELPSTFVSGLQCSSCACSSSIRVRSIKVYRTSQFAGCFLPAQTRVWNDIPYTVFDTGTLHGLVASLNLFFSFPWCRCLWGCVSNL